MAMSDNREFTPRGRGRGRGRGQPFQHHQAEQHQPRDGEREQAKSETVTLLEGFLGRRYDANTKLLDLSSIASDEAVRRSGMFDNERTQKKFFPALMVVCDTMLPTRDQKIAAIDSVSLANNNVPNLNVIYELVKSLNHIKNLDLSGNAFASLIPLKPWKNRFKSLEHLIVDPFPEITWEDELTDWFPRLRILNGKQVRPDANTPQTTTAAVAPTTCGTNVSAAPLNTEEQQKKEEMIAFVQQATNLNRDYAIQCLEAGNWNLQQASDLFTQSRHTLPPNAFV
jgi:nuclear RNA export factor